jgi:O-antigen/teichoic acid export membrane protein
VEFGKHLAKGFWGLADKALPVVYGVGYVLLVIRVLPTEEFGNFVLIQEIFLVISGLATGLALQPLLKYGAERTADHRDTVGATMILYTAFLVLCSLIVFALRKPFSLLLNASVLEGLMIYIPAMLGASFFRNFTLALLQGRFLLAEVFWVDATHFLGAPLLIMLSSRMGLFHSAFDLVMINVITLTASSAVGLLLSRSLLSMTFRPRRDVFQKVRAYGTYSLGSITSYLVYTKADTFLLSAFTGPVQVAVYNSVKVFVRVFEMASQVLQMFVLPATSKLSSDGDTGSLKVLAEKSILFSTIGMFPVFVLFLAFPALLVGTLYQGRYGDAIPLLQIFSVLSFVVPMTAVGSNILMGLGMAKEVFILALEMLVISLVAYFVCIPWLGEIGAALGYVVASGVIAWLTIAMTNRVVPITTADVLRRTNDIQVFIGRRFMR